MILTSLNAMSFPFVLCWRGRILKVSLFLVKLWNLVFVSASHHRMLRDICAS